jgi:hypothetical protein
MKLKGEFVLREIMGEVIAIPVGDAALGFNGMICLNPVGNEIWKGLQADQTREEILEAIVEAFEVSRQEAGEDLDGFLLQLKQCNLLED